jgi:uncharacterized protein
MSQLYHAGNRELQDRFDTRWMADRIEDGLVRDVINESDAAFIKSIDMFFMATADEHGRPTCSYKGGDPGLVRVLDERTIAFPNYEGNGMFLTMGNLRRNPHVGLLFINFERGQRLRLNGSASIESEDPLMAEYPEAQFIIRVAAREVFRNCPRYVRREPVGTRSSSAPARRARQPLAGAKHLRRLHRAVRDVEAAVRRWV